MTVTHNGIELRPINEYPGYWAGADGNIYKALGINPAGEKFRQMKVHTPGGRRKVYVLIHKALTRPLSPENLVALAWHGPRPTPNMDAEFIDGDETNCKPENLRWNSRVRMAKVTAARDAYFNGPDCDLPAEDIIQALLDYADDMDCALNTQSLADRLCCARSRFTRWASGKDRPAIAAKLRELRPDWDAQWKEATRRHMVMSGRHVLKVRRLRLVPPVLAEARCEEA